MSCTRRWVKIVTPHRTRMMHHRRIFLVTRTVIHPMHMHWLKVLTSQDELHLSVRVIRQSHSIVSCPIAISWACLPILLAFLLYWRRNWAQTAPIHGAVHGLAVWLTEARSLRHWSMSPPGETVPTPTTTAASDVTDFHDERQLTSPLFTQETEVRIPSVPLCISKQ